MLTKDKVIVESSSGNTGIGLAMVGAMKGYKVLVTMSERASVERVQMLKILGAEVVLTSAAGGSDEAWDKADEIARNDPALPAAQPIYQPLQSARALRNHR